MSGESPRLRYQLPPRIELDVIARPQRECRLVIGVTLVLLGVVAVARAAIRHRRFAGTGFDSVGPILLARVLAAMG
jgi:hypothetical protein